MQVYMIVLCSFFGGFLARLLWDWGSTIASGTVTVTPRTLTFTGKHGKYVMRAHACGDGTWMFCSADDIASKRLKDKVEAAFVEYNNCNDA